MKVLICPDKFKGSLSATEVGNAAKMGIKQVFPDASFELLPLADGGEGTLVVLSNLLDLQMVKVSVSDPLFRPVTATYGINGTNAYIEMARASGFELLSDEERSATKTSSVGTGELVQEAMARGAKSIYLFVGGSATNDGGIGMASALGFRFLDKEGSEVSPIGSNLSQIETIVNSEMSFDVTLHLVTDVQNPLLGKNGATFQYGPQKGATESDVQNLEKGMKHLSNLISKQYGKDVSTTPGSGAAGGMALSVLGLMNGTIQSGIDTILQAVDFEERLKTADLIITGEGKMDEQTLQGKVVHGVVEKAKSFNVPVLVICGDSQLDEHQIASLGVEQVLKLKTDELTVDYCLQNAAELITLRLSQYLKNHQRFKH